MKHLRSLGLCIASGLTLAGTVAFAYTINSYRATGAAPLHLPATPDSLQKENPFAPEQLLSSRPPLNLEMQRQDWTTMETDTAGNLRLVSADANPYIRTFQTGLIGRRFAKGKLIISSTSPARVLVNGSTLIEKNTSDSTAVSADAPLTLNPEAYQLIQIDILALPDAKSEPEFSLEFIPDAAFENVEFASGPDLKERFSVRTCTNGPRVSKVELSPDGRYAIMKYYEVFDAKTTSRYTKLIESATGKVISEDINNSAQWMPTGATLYYTSANGYNCNLYTLDVPSMRTTLKASNLPNEDFSISPDGKYLFYYKNVEAKAEEGPLRRVKNPDDRIPGDRTRNYLVRYDIANDISLPITYGGSTTYMLDISRDGSKLLYMSSRQTPDRYPFYTNTLVQMDMKTLRHDTIIANNDYLTGAIYSPDAKKLFITGGPETFGSIGVNAGDHEIPNAFDAQGYIYDIESGKAIAVTRDFDPSVSGTPVWNYKNNLIYFTGTAGFYEPLYCLNPRNNTIAKLDAKVATVNNFSIGNDESAWLAYTGQGFTETGLAYMLNLKTGESRLLDDPWRANRDRLDLGKIEHYRFTASDGTEIDGVYCLPPDFDSSKKYPMIVYYYGGTTPSDATMHHPYTPEVFASRDYVVYVVNPSGTIGYGQEFSARHVNAWGKRTADDIIEGVKAFCKDHKFVDDKKIGCLGASYGGFMTQYLQTKTDIFAAAVSHAGISNVTSYWGEGYWGYSYNSVAAAKSYPWSDPELFTRQGSLFNADKIHTPLLLLHGSRDTNVPIGESIQLFNALKILGRDVEFITVDDQDHIITDYDKRQIWQNTIMAFFAKYLQDDPSWWDSMYGDK